MHPTRALLIPSATVGLAALASAQCAPSWQIDRGFGTNGEIHCAVEWDPDGPGPGRPELVVGGTFTEVCDTPATNLARIDLQTLTVTPFGMGANDRVRALAIGSAGELIASGAFTQIDGVAATGVARYAGGWLPYGSGVDITSGGPMALLAQPGGALVVGGRLQTAGGLPVASVARWDGTAWTALGPGLRPYDSWGQSISEESGVRALVASANGVIAVGLFDATGSTPLYAVAEWNGTAWQAVGHLPNETLVAPTGAAVTPNGDLFVCTVGFGSALHRWDGTAWSLATPPAGAGFSGPVRTLTVLPTGELVAVSTGGITGPAVERWNGSTWQLLGSDATPLTARRILAIAPLPSRGQRAMVVGGRQLTQMTGNGAPSTTAQSLLLYDDQSGWFGNDQAFNTTNLRLHAAPDGEIYAYAQGTAMVGSTSAALFQRSGGTWTAVPGTPANISAVTSDLQGRLLLGAFGSIYRLEAGVLTQLHISPSGVPSLEMLPNGTLVAGNGYFWTSDGTRHNLGATPILMAVHPDGRMIGAGYLGNMPIVGRVGSWDGTSWTGLDPAVVIDGLIDAIAVLPDGDIVVGGNFTYGNSIARLRGTTWQGLGAGFNGRVTALAVLADGRLVARGDFTSTGAVACPGAAVWDGQTWTPLAGDPRGGLPTVAAPNGELWTLTPNRVAAQLQMPCAATATTLRTDCTNVGAAANLRVNSWPMIGASFRSQVTGMPANALTLAGVGFQSVFLPLAGLLPQAAPGCAVRVLPEALYLDMTTRRFTDFVVDVPAAASLVGVAVQEQAVVVELTGAGGILGATSSATLTLTIGSSR